MEVQTFINMYKEAFGPAAELPLAFWYDDTPVAETQKEGHCIFARLNEVRTGTSIALNVDNLACGGGKFYCGFTPMPPYVPTFVSTKERYKESPELVSDMLQALDVTLSEQTWLNFVRIDKLTTLDKAEALLFYATPDILSGLITWATFDTNAEDAIATLFGSGCTNIITYPAKENAKGGYRCFTGLFDPSARKYVESDRITFSIPMSRFRTMYKTMPDSCLFDTPAWSKIKERINRGLL